MSTYQIHIFISHSWRYSEHYEKLVDWIFNQGWKVNQILLDFKDYSIPKNDPIHNASNDAQLKQAIYAQISNSHVVVIPTGMYVNYSKWIKKETDGAIAYSKPILAVDPWGQEKQSSIVQEKASESVGWNKQSVINAIWKLYKDE